MTIPASKLPSTLPHNPDAERAPGAHVLKESATPVLRDCIARYQARIPGLADVAVQLHAAATLDALIALYEPCYPMLEQAMWSGAADFHPLLATYQTGDVGRAVRFSRSGRGLP